MFIIYPFGVHMGKCCCGFGHRTVLEPLDDRVRAAVFDAAENGFEIFYTGAMGDFDRIFSSAVREVKKKYPAIKLICVKPYFSNEINTNAAYYAAFYDDILIPSELIGVHFKAAITARNRWMIDHSDLAVIYCTQDFGGANDALKYAERKEKAIIRV